jgi:dTDP-4-dehydrorhamnose reductase
VDAAANVARSCAARQIKLVHISTDHIFTGTQRLLDESAIPAPVNVYALTKVDAEQTVAKICPSALIVRTNYYGWGPSYRRSFSDVIIDALRHGRTITLFEDVFFTPILVDVLIETIHSLVDRDAVGIYNVVGDERLSKYQFGLNIAHRFGLGADVLKAGKIGDARSLVRRPRDMSLCNQKLRAALGTDLGGTKEHLSRLAIEEHSARVQELQRL